MYFSAKFFEFAFLIKIEVFAAGNRTEYHDHDVADVIRIALQGINQLINFFNNGGTRTFPFTLCGRNSFFASNFQPEAFTSFGGLIRM